MDIPNEILYHHILPLVTNKQLMLVSKYCYDAYKERLSFGIKLDIDLFTSWCQYDDIAAASKFIKCSVPDNWNTMLKIACDNNNVDIIEILLSYPVNINDAYCLRAACHGEKLDILDILLQDGRFHIDDYTLASSVGMNKLGAVKRLLKDPRADPSINNNECYRTCIEKGYADMGKLLLQDMGVRRLHNGKPIRHYLVMEYPIGTINVICEIRYGNIYKWEDISGKLNTIIPTSFGVRYRNEDMIVNCRKVNDAVYLREDEAKQIFIGLQLDIPPLVAYQLRVK